MFCVSHTFTAVNCYLVVTYWERADLLALVGDVYCIFVTFPCGIRGQVWYLIVLFLDLCRLSYFYSVWRGLSLRRWHLKLSNIKVHMLEYPSKDRGKSQGPGIIMALFSWSKEEH